MLLLGLLSGDPHADSGRLLSMSFPKSTRLPVCSPKGLGKWRVLDQASSISADTGLHWCQVSDAFGIHVPGVPILQEILESSAVPMSFPEPRSLKHQTLNPEPD